VQDLEEIVQLNRTCLDLRIKHPVRYSYLYTYVLLLLEEIMISINMFLNRQKFLDDLEVLLTQNASAGKVHVHFQILQMGSLLNAVNGLWSESRQISQFSRVLCAVFKNIFRSFDLAILVARDSLLLQEGMVERYEIT
jgi:hypothetical protein